MRKRPGRARGYLVTPLFLLWIAQAGTGEPPREGVDLFYSGDYSGALAILGSSDPAASEGGEDLETAYWMGACLLKMGRYEEALGYFRDAADSSRVDPRYRRRSLLLAGTALEELGRDTEAEAAFSALLSDPESGELLPEALFRLAGTAYRAGRFGKAAELYSRIVLDHPMSAFVADALFFLAECDMARGNLPSAERRYAALLSTYPNTPRRRMSRLRLAEIAYASGKSADALRIADELSSMDPADGSSGPAMRLKAAVFFDSGLLPQSIQAYEAAVGLLADSPEIQGAHFELGITLLSAGRNRDAVPHFESALQGGAESMVEASLAELSRLYMEFGETDSAASALSRLADGFPGSGRREETLFVLAGLLRTKGDVAGSRRRLDALVSDYPGSMRMPEYLYRRGVVCLDSGDAPSALESFQRIVRDFPRSDFRGESLYSIGHIYSTRREYSRAIPYLQAVSAAYPNPDLLRRSALAAGACQFNIGDYEKAFLSFDSLIGNAGSETEGSLYFYSARALYRMGRFAEAARRFARASELSAGPAASAEARYWLGWSDYRLGSFDLAREDFLAAAERFPEAVRAADSLLQAAICSARLGNDPDAVVILDRALTAMESSERPELREKALYEKGSALSRMGRQAESDAVFSELARVYPGGRLAAEAFFREAAEARDGGRHSEAMAGFLKVYRSFPADPLAAQALYWAAETSLLAGNAAESAGLFWEYVLNHAEGAFLSSVLDGLKRAFSAAGNTELASEYVRKARLDPGISAYILSSIELDFAELELSRNPDEARFLAEEISRRMLPESILREAGLLLGKCSMAKKQWARAKEIFVGLASSKGDRVSALARLEFARVLQAEGDLSEAMQVFASVSSLYPAFPDLSAEGLYHAVLAARSRGDVENAAAFRDKLKNGYPRSPWTEKLDLLRDAR